MKINDLLNELSQDIADSYDAIEAAGGTVPVDKTTSSLSSAIMTIPVSSSVLYGKVGVYPYSEEQVVDAMGVEGVSIDQAKFEQFLQENPPEMPDWISFMREAEWDPETGEPTGNYVWRYWGQGEPLSIPDDSFTATTGISYTSIEDEMAEIMIGSEIVIDTEGEVSYYEFNSLQDYNAFPAESGNYAIINGQEVLKDAICSFETGSEITELPANILCGMSNLTHIDISNSAIRTLGDRSISELSDYNEAFVIPSGVTKIPDRFFWNMGSFDQDISVPSGVTEIGERFMGRCGNFNSTLTLPDTLRTIGDYFLSFAYSFNQPISIPNAVTSIGINFMYVDSKFNQPLNIPTSLTSISNYFMESCGSFNQPLTIPLGVTSIGDNFMKRTGFNQSLTIPSSVTSIGGGFMEECSKFNQPINLPSSLTSIGPRFLNECRLFNQPITIPQSITVIPNRLLGGCVSFNSSVTLPSGATQINGSFLSSCIAFNTPITIPDSVTSLGESFLYDCRGFSQNIKMPSSLTKIENSCLMGANNMTGTIDFGDLSPDNMTMPLYRQNCWATTDSTAPIYTVGLTYTGRHARRWQDLFPSMSTPRYRKVWVS